MTLLMTIVPQPALRICSMCKDGLPTTDFHKHKYGRDGLRSRCKACNRLEARQTYRRNPQPYKRRARAFNKLHSERRIAEADRIKATKGCLLCGEREPCVLDFHHTHGNSKGREGGMPVSRAACHSNKRFLKELSQCVVLCANCHRKVHAKLLTLPDTSEDLSTLVKSHAKSER